MLITSYPWFHFLAGEYVVRVITSEETDSGTDSNVTLTVYGDLDNTGPITLGSTSTGYFYTGKVDDFDVSMLVYKGS